MLNLIEGWNDFDPDRKGKDEFYDFAAKSDEFFKEAISTNLDSFTQGLFNVSDAEITFEKVSQGFNPNTKPIEFHYNIKLPQEKDVYYTLRITFEFLESRISKSLITGDLTLYQKGRNQINRQMFRNCQFYGDQSYNRRKKNRLNINTGHIDQWYFIRYRPNPWQVLPYHYYGATIVIGEILKYLGENWRIYEPDNFSDFSTETNADVEEFYKTVSEKILDIHTDTISPKRPNKLRGGKLLELAKFASVKMGDSEFESELSGAIDGFHESIKGNNNELNPFVSDLMEIPNAQIRFQGIRGSLRPDSEGKISIFFDYVIKDPGLDGVEYKLKWRHYLYIETPSLSYGWIHMEMTKDDITKENMLFGPGYNSQRSDPYDDKRTARGENSFWIISSGDKEIQDHIGFSLPFLGNIPKEKRDLYKDRKGPFIVTAKEQEKEYEIARRNYYNSSDPPEWNAEREYEYRHKKTRSKRGEHYGEEFMDKTYYPNMDLSKAKSYQYLAITIAVEELLKFVGENWGEFHPNIFSQEAPLKDKASTVYEAIKARIRNLNLDSVSF